jgi:3-hydroxyisobutyrate dehydrogenase
MRAGRCGVESRGATGPTALPGSGSAIATLTPMLIGFVGLGRMGSGMAARLIGASHDVAVFNRTPQRAEPLRELGARVVGSPREVAEDADAVVCMVADDEASREVWLGADGVLAGRAADGAFAVECSTLSRGWVLDLAARAQAAGWRYVDAPVTGLPDAAASGALTLLVGAEQADLDAGAGVLGPLSARVVHFGAVGTGTAYKLIHNMLGAVQIASAAEALALAERAGLDLAQVVGTLATSQAASPQVVRTTGRMLAADADAEVTFSGRLRRKDAAYAAALAREVDAATPFGDVALAGLDALIAAGRGDVNETAIIEIARRPGL